jgi:hypothetical protein
LPFHASGAAGGDANQREASGDLVTAKSLLEQDARSGNSSAQEALAEFLSRHRDPNVRDAYVKWADNEQDASRKRAALRQVLLYDFEEGHSSAIARDLDAYHAAGGTDLQPFHALPAVRAYGTISLPGPLRSFARMAALSPDLPPEDLLPALARNIVTTGYQAVSSNESLEQTEYLRLIIRYLAQARELSAMAGTAHKIVVPNCDSEQTGELLKALGYRMRGSCGGDVVLETVNPTRAFLTVDSAFPLAQLEQNLRANRRFELDYAPTQIPVLYGPDYWLSSLGAKENRPNFLDAFLNDPSLCRLYLGLSKLDSNTAEALRKKVSGSELKLYAPVLDFFGSLFQVKDGVAFVPGSPKAWAEIVGVSPSQGAAFYQKLIEEDDGWLASYFDSLARLDSPAAAYLLQPEHMKRFYNGLRGKVTTPGPARPVFRSSSDLMLLTTSLRLDSNGHPHLPGGLEVWKALFVKHPHGKYDNKLSKAAANWHSNDDAVEALFALCRKSVENEPLHIFLALNDVDRARSKPISSELASRLVSSWRMAGSQYSILAGAPTLNEASMGLFLDFVTSSNEIHDSLVRADAVGSAQALVGLWEILCREKKIPEGAQNEAFSSLLQPFLQVKQSVDVFDASRNGVRALLRAANVPATRSLQDHLIDLLVGTPRVNADQPGPAENLLRILDAQHLLSLDKIYAAADSLAQGGGDKKALQALANEMARFEETQSLRNSLSGPERNLLALGYWSERHIDQERKLNFADLAKTPDRKDVRGKFTPLVRDTLVGLLYAYYAPPGAQLVLANPLFVRNHDFIGAQGLPMTWRPTETVGSGWPSSAGGRLMGSLVSLPYTLAEAEQNFLTPTREQALIWGDLVPQIMVDVTVNRWQNVTPEQIRWVALHLRHGENLLAASAFDASLEAKVMHSLARFASPARIEQIQTHLHAGQYGLARSEVLPSELYALSNDPKLSDAAPDVTSLEIAKLSSEDKSSLSPAAISEVFGTPKPTLSHSYRPGLLYLRTFPTLMGYSSRLLAESWESNGFYYAALADELGVPANQLDIYVPQWTRATIENIFATHLEDWPALLRSLNAVGTRLRQRNGSERAALNATSQATN